MVVAVSHQPYINKYIHKFILITSIVLDFLRTGLLSALGDALTNKVTAALTESNGALVSISPTDGVLGEAGVSGSLGALGEAAKFWRFLT